MKAKSFGSVLSVYAARQILGQYFIVGHNHLLSLLSRFIIHNCLPWIGERMNMVGRSPGQPCAAPLHVTPHLCSVMTSDKLTTQIDGMEASIQVTASWSGARHTERRMEEDMCPLFSPHNFNYLFLMLHNIHIQHSIIKQSRTLIFSYTFEFK